MTRFIFADLRRLWAGSLVVVLLIAFATALGVAVTLQERALRLGSARAADRFDLVVGAPGSETQLLLSSVFLQPSPLPLMSGDVLSKLAADPRVSWAAPVGFGDSFSGYPIVGTSTALATNLSAMSEGRVFSKAGEAVIGAAVTLPLGYAVKPVHGTAGGETHTELAYRITGRLAPTGTSWDRAILVPIQAVWGLHGMDAYGHEADEAHAENTAGDPAAGVPQDEAAHHDDPGHREHAAIDPDAPLDEHWTAETPGLPAILVKPKTIADAYKLRQDYRGNGTLAVFPGEVLTNLYATLGALKPGKRWKSCMTRPICAPRQRSRLRSDISAISTPPQRMEPPSAQRSSPVRICTSVLLPDPDAPVIATRLPASMESEAMSRTGVGRPL